MATTDKTKAATGPACPEGLDVPGQTREEYAATVLEQIGAFEERLDELETDMESSGWDDIGDFRGQLDDLRARLKGLRSRADELIALADPAWPDAYEEMEEALLAAAGSIEDLTSGLRMVLPE